MTNTTKVARRIGVVAAGLVSALVLAYGGWAAWMYHVTFASDADCKAAQAVVRGGAVVSDAGAAKTWAAAARTRTNTLEHKRLRAGVTTYIALVEQTFTATPPTADARGAAFGDMFDACRDIDVNFPAPH